VLHVCDDIACRTNGAEELIDQLRFEVGHELEERVRPSPCLGMCERAPAALLQIAGEAAVDTSIAPISMQLVEPLTMALKGRPLLASSDQDPAPQGRHALRLLRRVGQVHPASLEDYRANGGYEALARALEVGSEGVVAEVKASKLLGRGGAAFPAGLKWELVAKQAATPHYFVCNADESEPGTFKDRVIMEGDPFSVIESLTIAGFATGSETGYIYIRGEYPRATETLERAIATARETGLLGPDVMGSGFAFDIELRRGAGAYICGEETALFNSIEGRRGEPRNKPPFPVERGLFGRPTGINNVETLVNVLEILRIGGEAYAAIGTPDSTGPRLFCLSGCVERPGVYEVEHGVTLGELLELAGGVRGGRPLKAILLGGAAGSFVRPDELDLRLTFEDTRAAGVTLGSGVVMAFDDTVDLADIVLRIAAFFRDESCGQCVPCRVGTVRQEEALARVTAGRPRRSLEQELALIDEIGQVMRDASICGLGQLAANAVDSAVHRLKLFDGGAV
jgi:NADH-quinone oxidoreductase subunit F